MRSLKPLTVALMLLLILAACGQQSTPASTPVNVEMSVRAEPEPLTAGETTLIVTLKDRSGSPVDGATLQVHGDMDHEGMTPVDREASESENGEYRVPFEWAMGGDWIVTVTAQLPDGVAPSVKRMTFSLRQSPAKALSTVSALWRIRRSVLAISRTTIRRLAVMAA